MPLFPGDNCNRAYITELLKPFFEVKHIFISTQQKGRAWPPLPSFFFSSEKGWSVYHEHGLLLQV